MHLQHTAGVGSDRIGIVGQRGAVGGADLAESGTGRRDQVGQAEAVTDLDHLTAADDDLSPGRERCRSEDQGRGAVADHHHVTRGRHRIA